MLAKYNGYCYCKCSKAHIAVHVNLKFKFSYTIYCQEFILLTTLTTLMSACDLINTSTTDEWPPETAQCNGVALFYLNETFNDINCSITISTYIASIVMHVHTYVCAHTVVSAQFS